MRNRLKTANNETTYKPLLKIDRPTKFNRGSVFYIPASMTSMVSRMKSGNLLPTCNVYSGTIRKAPYGCFFYTHLFREGV